MSAHVKIGIEMVDKALVGGIPYGDLSCLSSADDRIGSIVLGHFLAEGIKNKETVALITFDQPNIFIENFSFDSFNFSEAYKAGKFIFLNYQSSIRQKINFLQNYDELFEEIKALSGGVMPDRIAFHGVDALLNLANVQMSHVTAERFGSACKSKLTENTTVLAHYVHYHDQGHRDLGVALEKVSAASVSIEKFMDPRAGGDYEVKIRKSPWMRYDGTPKKLNELELFKVLGIDSRG